MPGELEDIAGPLGQSRLRSEQWPAHELCLEVCFLAQEVPIRHEAQTVASVGCFLAQHDLASEEDEAAPCYQVALVVERFAIFKLLELAIAEEELDDAGVDQLENARARQPRRVPVSVQVKTTVLLDVFSLNHLGVNEELLSPGSDLLSVLYVDVEQA